MRPARCRPATLVLLSIAVAIWSATAWVSAAPGVIPSPREWRLSLLREGRPGDLRPADASRVTVSDDGFDFDGPEEPSLLWFDFALPEEITPKVGEDGRSVIVAGRHLDLRATDADGRDVDARWERIEPAEASGPSLRLVVEGADHALPLHVSWSLMPPGEAIQSTSILTAPSNDTCAGAEVVPASGPFPYLTSIVDVTDATAGGDPALPSCQADVSRSVWFTFTPATTALYDLSICADAPTASTLDDTVLAGYAGTGQCAGLAEIAGGCSDDSCGPTGRQSDLTDLYLAAGTTYSIVAWSYGAAAPPAGAADIQLSVVQRAFPGPAPPNDQCGGAEIIPGAGPFPYLTAVTSDISGATTGGDPPPPACQPNVSRSIWYSFAPTITGRYAFRVCADGPTGTTVDDTVVAVYSTSGACAGLVELSGGCDDDSCVSEAAQSAVAGVTLDAGTTYDVVVWKYGSAAPAAGNTAVQLRVSRINSLPNDTCAAPQDLPLEVPLAGTTVTATDDVRLPPGSACFGGVGQIPSTASGGDVAYRFTAPAVGRYSFRLSGYDASKNAVLHVSSDCPSGPSPALIANCLGAANRSASSPEEVSCLLLSAGQSVYVHVDEDGSSAGSVFTIEVTRCALEVEPNGAPASAGTLACGLEGSISPAGDVDFFTLGTPASGSRVFALVDGATGNSTDFDLRVTTGADTLEYDDFNNDVPFGSVSPNVAGSPLTGSPSFLRVSHYSASAQAEPYRLYATVQPPSGATAEVEPNDSIATATHGAGGYFSGSLSGAGDVDLFSFSAAAGELIQLGLDLDPLRNNTPFNGSLALLDASGGTLLLVNDTSSTSSTASGTGSLSAPAPFSPAEGLVYRARVTGPYFAKVAWSSGAAGDYLVSIAHGCSAVADSDGDGTLDSADCAPADPTTWAVPGEATSLAFSSPTSLTWAAPASAGGTAVTYDVVRSTARAGFQSPACPAAAVTGTSASDLAIPGTAFYYLVRTRNTCGGTAGATSSGASRVVGSCP
ncbi:MAG: hypothetical protein HY049_11910 [Acidobacteria bacterium]|nr:hypothetical protein [Acidobacteriota bacterium]